jgi:hypothetical protein
MKSAAFLALFAALGASGVRLSMSVAPFSVFSRSGGPNGAKMGRNGAHLNTFWHFSPLFGTFGGVFCSFGPF